MVTRVRNFRPSWNATIVEPIRRTAPLSRSHVTPGDAGVAPKAHAVPAGALGRVARRSLASTASSSRRLGLVVTEIAVASTMCPRPLQAPPTHLPPRLPRSGRPSTTQQLSRGWARGLSWRMLRPLPISPIAEMPRALVAPAAQSSH
jgi:hypothetical protein